MYMTIPDCPVCGCNEYTITNLVQVYNDVYFNIACARCTYSAPINLSMSLIGNTIKVMK